MMNLMYLVPKNILSWIVGVLVHLPLPGILRLATMKWFAGRYNINLEEAEKPIGEYKSIGDLFIRKLKPGLRPIESDIIHPVDACLTSFGKIESSQLLQAKGLTYPLNGFIGEPKGEEMFIGGSYYTYYLCPTDYHRVHSPVAGPIKSIHYLPGALWPVNEWSVGRIKNLFSVNERVVIWIESEWGPVAYVMVGATNVGKMTLSFDSSVITNQNPLNSKELNISYNPPIENKAGDELGAFNMGSTVIILYPPQFPVDPSQVSAGPTRLGQALLKV